MILDSQIDLRAVPLPELIARLERAKNRALCDSAFLESIPYGGKPSEQAFKDQRAEWCAVIDEVIERLAEFGDDAAI